MINVSKEAREIYKSVSIKCKSFSEFGESYKVDVQKRTLKEALSKSKSRVLVGSPNIFSSEVLFCTIYKILDKKKFNCLLLTEAYIKDSSCLELINRCSSYDYIFINGLGINQNILTGVRRLLQDYDLGLVIAYNSYYRETYPNGQSLMVEHNPVLYDREHLYFGNFDSYVYLDIVSRRG